MIYSKQLLILFLVLINIGLIIAPPATSTVFDFKEGYDLKSSQELYLKQNTLYKYHIHIFNVSSGSPILNQTTGCYFHLYNHTGSHIYKGYQRSISNDFDFEFIISGSNFTNKGQYSYIVQCNNSEIGGELTHYFYVTGNGEENLEGIAKLILYLFFMLVFAGLIVSFFIQLTKLALLDVTVYDVIMSLIFYVLLVFCYFMAKNYLLTTMTEDLMGWGITVGSFTNVILPLIAFLISFFKKSFDKGRVISIQELNGGRFGW